MQKQNGPSDGNHSQQTSALSMGPPSVPRLSSMPPATDEIDADWGDDGIAGAPAEELPHTPVAAEEHEQPTSGAANDPEAAEPPPRRASATAPSPTPSGQSSPPPDTREVAQPPKVRSLRSLQPTLLLFTGGPAPSAETDTAAPVPASGADASPSASTPPELDDANGPRASGGALPSGEPETTLTKSPSAASQSGSQHPTHVEPWRVPTKAAAAARNAEAHGSSPSLAAEGPKPVEARQTRAAVAGGTPTTRERAPAATRSAPSVSQASASTGPVASSLRLGHVRGAAVHKPAWGIAVAASAALAVAAGYWAFHPAAAEETDASTNDAPREAVASPPPQPKSVGVPQGAAPTPSTPAPGTPAQPDSSPSDEKPPTSAPPGASPQAASDKPSDSQAQKPAPVGETVPVNVKVIPSTAILFQGSKRLGEGSATVEVTVGKPAKLVILHRGYYYRRVKLDGREREVTVRLKKIVPEDAKPGDETRPE